jgi:aminoglycoside phosphotransferase (APT) family kinase protein
LLEDLAPREPGDQVTGCAVDEAATALEELAKVHAPRCADPSLARLEWLNRRNPDSLEVLASIFPGLWSGFVDRYEGRLLDQVRRVGDAFFPRIREYFLREEEPRTVQHADYRVDNLLFGGPVESPLAVVDWQTVTFGPGTADVAYFLGGSVDVDDRRKHEEELLRHYLDVARGYGIPDYAFNDLWDGYRRHAYSGLVMAVGAAMMVARTDRGDDMFLAMAHRHAAHVEDMGADALLSG